ncbi:lysophospholipid acyltransferase family protein [Sulfurimonas sp.]|uniref:lysophospholipid acyltransferase family protein n=1 Tax=Sulfurimonas sp. TaxID=2022749 RepID=UPI002AAF2CC5|nr:lysophospholipid acyltransferase family protein [Sulfurimonas sp.]
MQLKCILSVYVFVLFFGLIGVMVLPSLAIYYIIYPFTKYPQDTFQKLASYIYKTFYFLVPKIQTDIKIQNTLATGAIYISTHQSSLDYPLLGMFIPKYLTITNINVKNIPFINYIGKLIGVRYLNKSSIDEVHSIFEEFEEMLNANRNVLLFPEGTRGDGKKLSRFKHGAFRLSFKTNKPVIPILLDGSSDIITKGDFCFNNLDTHTIKVTILEPIYPNAFKNENEMLKYVQNFMEQKLKESRC